MSDRNEPLFDCVRIVVPPSRHQVDIIVRKIRGERIETMIHGVSEFCDPTVPIIRMELMADG